MAEYDFTPTYGWEPRRKTKFIHLTMVIETSSGNKMIETEGKYIGFQMFSQNWQQFCYLALHISESIDTANWLIQLA